MSLFKSPPAPVINLPPAPAAPAPPPAFGMIQGQRPGKKSTTPTFMGAGDIANAPMSVPGMSSAGTSGKTLLGL